MNQIPAWQRILAQAETEQKRVYSASFFAKRNISIIDQQLRAFNLSYALSESGMIKDNSRVAIVGGSFSGLTCAAALAARHDCVISVFERAPRLLKMFSQAGFRYLHPNLNARTTDANRISRDKATSFPLLNWSGNYSPYVADEIRRKFEHYRVCASIALHLGEEVFSVGAKYGRPLVRLRDSFLFEGAGRRELQFDIVIIATGFGVESIDSSTNDISYWHSGNPEFYWPKSHDGKIKEKILISGNGDSGIIELAHCLIGGFTHGNLFSFLPNSSEFSYVRPMPDYNRAVERLRYRQIEQGETGRPDVSGPVFWYWRTRHRMSESGKHRGKLSRIARYEADIYAKIDGRLSRYPAGSPLPPDLVVAVEKDIASLLSDMASYEIRDFIRKNLAMYDFGVSEMSRTMGKGKRFDITVVGRTPTVYSRKLSPTMWPILCAMEKRRGFAYERATAYHHRVDAVTGRVSLKLASHDGDDSVHEYDRVIVRHGPVFRFDLGEDIRVEPKGPHSAYIATNEPALWWDGVDSGKRWEEEFFAYFRTPRWKQMTERSVPFDDAGTLQLAERLDSVDESLLSACLIGKGVQAARLYKFIKKGIGSDEALDRAIRQFTSLSKAGVKPALRRTAKKRRKSHR